MQTQQSLTEESGYFYVQLKFQKSHPVGMYKSGLYTSLYMRVYTFISAEETLRCHLSARSPALHSFTYLTKKQKQRQKGSGEAGGEARPPTLRSRGAPLPSHAGSPKVLGKRGRERPQPAPQPAPAGEQPVLLEPRPRAQVLLAPAAPSSLGFTAYTPAHPR